MRDERDIPPELVERLGTEVTRNLERQLGQAYDAGRDFGRLRERRRVRARLAELVAGGALTLETITVLVHELEDPSW